MRRSRAASAPALGLLIALACATPSWAWGPVGHKVVCEIAFQELTPRAKAEVIRLIRTDPTYTTFAEACTWADEPAQKPRSMEHYVNVPRSFPRFIDARCPMAPTCVFTGIASDLQILRTSREDAAKLAALKYLGHWVGDLHQPLHVSFQDDRGGGRIRAAGLCEGSLHAVWDFCIVDQSVGTNVREISRALRASITNADRASWTGAGVVAWANESLLIARSTAARYCTQSGATCIYAPGNEEFHEGEPERVVAVDADYIAMQAPLVAARLRQAGVRLGQLLNGALGRLDVDGPPRPRTRTRSSV